MYSRHDFKKVTNYKIQIKFSLNICRYKYFASFGKILIGKIVPNGGIHVTVENNCTMVKVHLLINIYQSYAVYNDDMNTPNTTNHQGRAK